MLPVCASHQWAWASENAREFAKMRAGRVTHSLAKKAAVCVTLARGPGKWLTEMREVPGTRWPFWADGSCRRVSTITLRLDPDEALVIADELACMGDDVGATGIILAVERLADKRAPV